MHTRVGTTKLDNVDGPGGVADVPGGFPETPQSRFDQLLPRNVRFPSGREPSAFLGPCVDAPGDVSSLLGRLDARSQALSCVRPLHAGVHGRQAFMEMRGPGVCR